MITGSLISKISIRTYRYTHLRGGISEVITSTSRITLIKERITVAVGGTLCQASSIGVGKSTIWAILNTLHRNIVDKSIGHARAIWYTFPIICFVLDIVVFGTIVYAHFHIWVHICEQLHSSGWWTVGYALTIPWVAPLPRRTVLRFYTMLVCRWVDECIIRTSSHTPILCCIQCIIDKVVVGTVWYAFSCGIKGIITSFTIL